MRTARRVFWNTAVLLGAEVSRLVIGILLTVAIARGLGSSTLGLFTYVMTLVGILGVVGDFGLSGFYVRAAQQDSRPSLVGAVLGVRTVVGGLVAAGMAVHAWSVREERTLAILLFLGSALLILGIWPSIVAAVLRAKERMAYEGAARTAGALATTAGGIGAVLMGWGIIGVAAVMVGVGLATLAYFTWLARRVLPGPLSVAQPRRVYSDVLRGAWPFASLAILVVIYFRIDSVMLYSLKGQGALGQYGAAYRLMEALLLIPLTLAGAALPSVARWLATRADEVVAAGNRAIHFLAMLAVPGAVFGALVAPQIFVTLYGPEFAEAGAIFRVLAFTLIPVFASSVTSSLITASARPVVNTYIAAVMVVLNITLNLIFIPRWSGVGAAAATVITEASGLVMGTLYIRRSIAPIAYGGEFVRPLLASAGIGLIILLYPVLAALPVYAAGYVVLLWALRGFTRDDLRFVRQLVMRPVAILPSQGHP